MFVELFGLSVGRLVSSSYLAGSVFTVQSAVLAACGAAQEACRAFVRADASDQASRYAVTAARLSLQAQGVRDPAVSVHPLGDSCSAPTVEPALEPGASYIICVRFNVALPFADAGFMAEALHAPTITGRTRVTVDEYRSQR